MPTYSVAQALLPTLYIHEFFVLLGLVGVVLLVIWLVKSFSLEKLLWFGAGLLAVGLIGGLVSAQFLRNVPKVVTPVVNPIQQRMMQTQAGYPMMNGQLPGGAIVPGQNVPVGVPVLPVVQTPKATVSTTTKTPTTKPATTTTTTTTKK